MSWRPLGNVLPGRLRGARLQLHYAAQLVSAPGTSLLPETSDYRHTNLRWDPGIGVLAGRPVGKEGLRAALVFESLELAVLEGEREKASRSLAGTTMERSLSWLCEQLAREEGELKLPDHEMPSHALAEGAVFSNVEREARGELAAWFANAAQAVQDAVAATPDASPVRCWPHHFDVASLITVARGEGPENARTIGVGLSAGDGTYDQPYYYVTPWPYPETDRLPALYAGAHWHTTGWTGAVFLGDELISERPEGQPALVKRVLGEAIEACRKLLGD